MEKSEIYTLAKEAFFLENKEAQQKLLDYYEVDNTSKVTDGASLAYCIYLYANSGMALGYAVLAGIDVERAREIADYPEIDSLWEHERYNSDGAVVINDMIETLLYEDTQDTKWKKAPHSILRQLIKEGYTHPSIPAFLEKYKSQKWVQDLHQPKSTKTKSKKAQKKTFFQKAMITLKKMF